MQRKFRPRAAGLHPLHSFLSAGKFVLSRLKTAKMGACALAESLLYSSGCKKQRLRL